MGQDENQDCGILEKHLEDTKRVIIEYEDKYTIAYQSLVQLIINQKDDQGMQDEVAFQDIDERQESLQNKFVQQLSIDQTQLK